MCWVPHGQNCIDEPELICYGGMVWKRLLAYITGSVDQDLLLRNEYLVTENRVLRNQIKGRLP